MKRPEHAEIQRTEKPGVFRQSHTVSGYPCVKAPPVVSHQKVPRIGSYALCRLIWWLLWRLARKHWIRDLEVVIATAGATISLCCATNLSRASSMHRSEEHTSELQSL